MQNKHRNGAVWGLCNRLTVDNGPDFDLERPALSLCFTEGIGGDFVTTGEFGCTEHSEGN
jgi:hypothetical protein